MQANAYCDRIAALIRGVGYWPTEWLLRVRFGKPGTYQSYGHPGFRGQKKVGRRSSWARVLTLQVRSDWEESVLARGLAVVQPEESGGKVFTLEALEYVVPEGADGCWSLHTAWTLGSGRHERARSGFWWCVRYAGRDWFAESGPEAAMRKAAQALEAGLGLAEELPF